MKRLTTVAIAAFLSIASSAHAAGITFIFEGSGRATLDTSSFFAVFTITTTADTADITSFGSGNAVDNATASIDIQGVGVFDIITPTRVFANTDNNTVGFSRSSGADLFNITDNAFAGFDLTQSIGPVDSLGQLLQWDSGDVMTTGGVLFFESFQTDARFTAIVDSEVPVPAAALLFGPALAGFMAWRRKRS